MMEKNNFLMYGVVFAGGFLMAFIGRFWFLLNNPEEVKKTAENKIHWLYEITYGIVNAIIGGFIGLGVYFAITYFEMLDSIPIVVFLSSMVASASSELFTMFQRKIVRVAKKADEKSDKAIDKIL